MRQIRKGAQRIEKSGHGFKTDVEKGLHNLASHKTKSARLVGFCITTKNRLWQLCRALPLNLLHASPQRDWVKVHLVVCDCINRLGKDGALDWVMKNYRSHQCRSPASVLYRR